MHNHNDPLDDLFDEAHALFDIDDTLRIDITKELEAHGIALTRIAAALERLAARKEVERDEP